MRVFRKQARSEILTLPYKIEIERCFSIFQLSKTQKGWILVNSMTKNPKITTSEFYAEPFARYARSKSEISSERKLEKNLHKLALKKMNRRRILRWTRWHTQFFDLVIFWDFRREFEFQPTLEIFFFKIWYFHRIALIEFYKKCFGCL